MLNFQGACMKTGRRLTPPMPMGYTHERPPDCSGQRNGISRHGLASLLVVLYIVEPEMVQRMVARMFKVD